MTIIQAIILGIVEGITEFIPISSTGHLILTGFFLEIDDNLKSTFDISIQLGAILAVVCLYWSFFKPFFSPKKFLSHDAKILYIAALPVFILGFLFYSYIKSLFDIKYVLISLGIGGLIMILVERFVSLDQKTSRIEDITYKQALIIGVSQCASLIPGTSRSASTIIGGLIAGLNYDLSARFSFILAVPVMVAAVSYELLNSFSSITSEGFLMIGIGFIVSFVVGLISMVTFIKILTRYKLTPFGVYRIITSILIYNLIV